MSDTNDKAVLLRGVLVPWNERAWENFREAYPEAASYLVDLVNAGGTNEEIRGYCDKEGYSRRSADWLVHAAEHLRRGMAQGAEPEPLGPIDLPPGPASGAAKQKKFLEKETGGSRGWATTGQIVTGSR